MIRASMVWGIARTELRLARRLVRYWVFLAIAALVAAFAYAQFAFIWRLFSANSASAAMANPRYFIANFGSNFLLFFLVGVVFLAFDVRARDRRERIVEVLDAKPCSNLELMAGRFVGLFLATYIPAVVVTGLLLLVSWLLKSPMEPWSTLGYLVFMAPPALAFGLGLVFAVTMLVRHRLIAAVVSLVVLVLAFFVSLFFIPLYATPFTDVTGGYSIGWPSDIAPRVIDGWAVLQRLGYLLAGLGLVGIAAALHPRKDDGAPGRRAAAGALLLVAGAAACAVQFGANVAALDNRRTWRAAHEALRDEPVPDVLAMKVFADVRPGSSLATDVDLTFRPPGGTALDRALFTLNPGLHVDGVHDAAGAELSFTHDNGLLDVALPQTLAAGETARVRITYRGRPDPDFAYLTAGIEPYEQKPSEAQIIVLGFDPIVFQSRFVALLPGTRWLPASGAEVGRGDPDVHPRDFFDLDLTVELPDGWLAAGPGRRGDPEEPAPAGRVRYRYRPGAPVPGAALVASRFESRSTEIDGVQLELLIDPDHLRNVDFFADASGSIHDWLAERLDEAKSVGLDYPYGALTMVEVPNSLRGYAGGWRMDSTFIQPAMILMRESGFPTAWFESARQALEAAREREGGVAEAKRARLLRFFENDLNGGNPFVAASRSFFGFQTAAAGPDGLPLDWVLDSLSSELVTEHRGFFSVHFFDRNFGQEFMLAGQAMNNPDRVADSYAEVLIHRITSKNAVWDTITGVSLADLDPHEDPERAIKVLSLKGDAMAESLLDDLGREKAGRFLAELRRRSTGRTFTREDFLAAAHEVGVDLDDWLRVWVEGTELPGFTLGPVRYFRLKDADNGASHYQLLVTVRNEEEAPGLVRLEYRLGRTDQPLGTRTKGEPVRVPARGAVEIGMTVPDPFRSARIAPYLSLNRDPFAIPLPELDPDATVDAEPFVGAREVAWTPAPSDEIIVDDLDDGFSVEDTEGGSFFRGSGRGGDEDLDRGLPVTERVAPSRWSRMTHPDAWGKYRHTFAAVEAGEGKRKATFTATLPRAGEWELYYHVPGTSSVTRKAKTWNLTLEDGSGSRDIAFEAGGAPVGWNSLGRFDVTAGEVRVSVSDRTDGDYVQADAVRWVPMSVPKAKPAEVARAGQEVR